jgi:DNA-binding NarL/FixJ family response regulator
MDKIRLLIIEDNNLLREGFVDMFKNQNKLEVEAGFGDEDTFGRQIRQFKPYVILLNSVLQSHHSLEVVQQLMKRFPDIKIVVMGLSLTKNEIIQFMAAGAAGFIFKEASLLDFIKTIEAVAKGEIVIPELLTDLLLSQIVEQAVVKGEIDLKGSIQITELELRLLKLINEGSSNREIGKKLDITPEQVKSHIHNIKQNLSLFSLLELVNIISPKSPSRDSN